MASDYPDFDVSQLPPVRGQAVNKDAPRLAWTGLYEVLDMKILHVDSKDSVEVYGKIILHSSTGFVFLFNREKDNPETVNLPGGAITLSRPNVSTNGINCVGITFELGGDLEEVNEENLFWDSYEVPFDSVLTTEIKGVNCSLALRYIIFSDAIVANIQIKLLRGEEEEEEEATICGNISASLSEWPAFEFTLFDKKSDDCVSVSGEELIPLSRSVISVPRGSELEIRVNLPVAAGTVCFLPQCCGDYVGIISDKIEVKVTFWAWNRHPDTIEAKKNFKPYYELDLETDMPICTQ